MSHTEDRLQEYRSHTTSRFLYKPVKDPLKGFFFACKENFLRGYFFSKALIIDSLNSKICVLISIGLVISKSR